MSTDLHGRQEEGPLHRLAHYTWHVVLAAGVLAILLGVIMLAWPGKTVEVAGVLFGLYLLVSGVLQLVSAFGTHGPAALRMLAFVSGVLFVLLGLFCFRSRLHSVLLLGLWIGIGWLFRGITQIIAAASAPEVPERGWQIFFGSVSTVAGLVLIDSPFSSVTVLAVVAGCWLVAVGIIEIIMALRLRSGALQLPPDV